MPVRLSVINNNEVAYAVDSCFTLSNSRTLEHVKYLSFLGIWITDKTFLLKQKIIIDHIFS